MLSSRLQPTWIVPAMLIFASCSVYSNPTVDLVLEVSNADAGRGVEAVISRFAERRRLVASSEISQGSTPESVRRLQQRTTHYVTGERYGEGRALTYLDASPTCKVVRVVELGAEWNEQSQSDLDELHAELSKLQGVVVKQGAKYIPGTDSGRGIDEYCEIAA
jgi:hypothetical protein